MLDPAATGLGLPLLVTVRSQAVLTLVVTVVLLFAKIGSPVDETEEAAVIELAVTLAVADAERAWSDAVEQYFAKQVA